MLQFKFVHHELFLANWLGVSCGCVFSLFYFRVQEFGWNKSE